MGEQQAQLGLSKWVYGIERIPALSSGKLTSIRFLLQIGNVMCKRLGSLLSVFLLVTMCYSMNEHIQQTKPRSFCTSPSDLGRAVSSPAKVDKTSPDVRLVKQPRKDRQGDPIPEKAVGRLGTIRVRPCDKIISVAYSPDGRIVASRSFEGSIHLWNANTGKELWSHKFSQRGEGNIVFSPDGKQLLSLGNEGVYNWDLLSHRSSQLSISSGSVPVCLSPYGMLVFRNHYSDLMIHDPSGRRIKLRLDRTKLIGKLIRVIAISPNQKLIATGEKASRVKSPATIRLWDTLTGEEIGKLDGHEYWIKSLQFSPDNKTLASADVNGAAILWDVTRRKKIIGLDCSARIVSFSPSGKLLATCDGFAIRLWDTTTYKQTRVLEDCAMSVAFSSDEEKLVTNGGGYALRIWRVKTGQRDFSFSGHEYSVSCIQFSPDGVTLASRSGDQTTRIWDLSTCKEIQRFFVGAPGYVLDSRSGGKTDLLYSLAYTADGKTLTAIGGLGSNGLPNNSIYLWNLTSEPSKATVHTLSFPPCALGFAPNSQTLATCTASGKIQLWTVALGKKNEPSVSPLTILKSPSAISFAFSPDGHTLATGGRGICLLDWTRKRQLRDLPGQIAFVISMTYSPGGHILASCGATYPKADDTINIWETVTGARIHLLDGLGSGIGYVTLSPNGRLLASAGQHDNAVRIWDVLTGKELAKFTGHRGPVYCVAFSPDGKTVASGSADTTILLWDVTKLQPESPPPLAQSELANELPHLWKKMQTREGAEAYQAIWRLIGAGDDAVSFLGQRLDPVPAPNARLVQQWIADLDSENFDKRQTATEQLTKLRELAKPALQQALQGKPSLEVRKRLESLLANIVEQSLSDTELRQIRALHALELIGSPAARAVLKKLADGAPGARLTRDAKLALQRLERRTAKP